MQNKLAMTGNGKHTTHKNGDDWGIVSMALLEPHYPLVNQHNYKQSPFSMGKSTINGLFSIAMSVYQRVYVSRSFLGLPYLGQPWMGRLLL